MITGYGSKNSRVGYDAVIQAESGFMFMNGEPGGASLKIPVALMDVLAGHQLKEGLLLALLYKERTGKGQLVEVSLIQSALASLANQGSNWLVANKLPGKSGSAHPNIAPYGDMFVSVDNKEILLAVGSDRQFRELCSVLSVPELADDEKFKTNSSRVAHRDVLNTLLGARISAFPAIELNESLKKANVPVAVIQNIQEALESPEAKSLFLESDEGIRGLRSFVAESNESSISPHILPPPHFGENTTEVLSKILHFTSESIDELRSSGVIN
jgi:crotonobetainyl-CoA:carnitine CoA-transferase CaiB-like acyl-CoA transferase